MTQDIKKLQDQSLWMRLRIVELAHKVGKLGAHIGGCFSIIEIFSALYASLNKLTGEDRDRVILSKAHAALAHYVLLEAIGVLTKEETDTYQVNGTHYYICEPRNIAKGSEFTGGSLALGLSFAVGVALACRKRNLQNHVYAIIGDGECDEGLIWESAMSITNYKLTNMTVIVDRNGVQLDGPTKDIMDTGDMGDKFRSFGFDVIEVDGHDIASLLEAFATRCEKPKAIIAHTIKGKGLSFCEGLHTWHHNVLTDKLYEQALEELK